MVTPGWLWDNWIITVFHSTATIPRGRSFMLWNSKSHLQSHFSVGLHFAKEHFLMSLKLGPNKLYYQRNSTKSNDCPWVVSFTNGELCFTRIPIWISTVQWSTIIVDWLRKYSKHFPSRNTESHSICKRRSSSGFLKYLKFGKRGTFKG